MFKKLWILPVLAVLAIIAGGGYYALSHGMLNFGTGESVYTVKVSTVNGADGYIADRYSGVVKPQSTVDVKKDADKEIAEVYVEEGQKVKKGDDLFRYDTSSSENAISTAELEIEGMENDITAMKTEIDEIKLLRDEGETGDAADYTAQIQDLDMRVRQAEFDLQKKQKELEKLKQNNASDLVTSPIDGTIKKIADDERVDYESDAFITITQTGDFRIMGKLDEDSVLLLTTGQKVIIRSRLDENQTWEGAISSIELEPEETQDDYYAPTTVSDGQATMYPFYVSVDSPSGLMLGQHVYIEPDLGDSQIKDGIWLDAGYVFKEDDKAYVWAVNSNDRIEKREVTLGTVDDETGEYQIKSGLSTNDYIAWNDASVKAGAKAVDTATENTNTSAEENTVQSVEEAPVENVEAETEAMPAPEGAE